MLQQGEHLSRILPEQPQLGGGYTFSQIASGLPLKLQGELQTAFQPSLSKGDGLPPPQDLVDHWEHCKTIIKGLGTSLSPDVLEEAHMVQLAPFLVGVPIWNAV